MPTNERDLGLLEIDSGLQVLVESFGLQGHERDRRGVRGGAKRRPLCGEGSGTSWLVLTAVSTTSCDTASFANSEYEVRSSLSTIRCIRVRCSSLALHLKRVVLRD